MKSYKLNINSYDYQFYYLNSFSCVLGTTQHIDILMRHLAAILIL